MRKHRNRRISVLMICCFICLLLTGCVTAALIEALSEEEQNTETRMIGEEQQLEAEATPETIITEAPTARQTRRPTAAPTEKPTAEQTTAATDLPTKAPTAEPTKAPTATPTKAPTAAPTKESTGTSTKAPTAAPTQTAEKTYSYVLNTSTKKFHKTSCSSVKDIKPEHRKDYTGTRQSVIDMGYQPCKRCNP